MYGPVYVKTQVFELGPYDYFTMWNGWVGEVYGDDPNDTCIGGGYMLGDPVPLIMTWQQFRVDECRPIGLPEGVTEGAEYNGWRVASCTNFVAFDVTTVTVYAMFLPLAE